MSTSLVYVKTYDEPEIDRREILRYAGVRGEAPEIESTLEECLTELSGKLTYQLCSRSFSVSFLDGALDIGFAVTESASLIRHVCGCREIVVFGATVGLEMDRLIAKYSRVAPSKALLMQAIGAERIESLCDVFCRTLSSELAAQGKGILPRFSPGYGDCPLELQKQIFDVLDCSRKIGLSLNQSMLMSPSKSVTAIVGVTDSKANEITDTSCACCQKTDCVYRRTE